MQRGNPKRKPPVQEASVASLALSWIIGGSQVHQSKQSVSFGPRAIRSVDLGSHRFHDVYIYKDVAHPTLSSQGAYLTSTSIFNIPNVHFHLLSVQ